MNDSKKGKSFLKWGFLLLLVSGIASALYFQGVAKGSLTLLQVLIYALQFLGLFFIIYQTTISWLGLRKYTPMVLAEPEKRFAIVVAAHNEEAVVGDIVENLNDLDYPKEMYDVYVICDNCTDDTATIVREKNGIAMERNDPTKRGKGYGLEWMFSNLWEMEKEGKVYDAVVMFDADNLVNREFLKIMNTRMLEGHDVVQGYLDSKNPEDTWITKSYAYAYWATNRIFQLSRQNIGLSAQIGGTGVAVSTKTLKEIGWGATSLTEDLEFTQRYLIQTGKPVAWAHEARVYDEKPLDMKSSWKQRIRWMQGHADCMFNYSYDLFKAFLTKKNKMLYFDSLIYLLQPSRIVLSIMLFVFAVLGWFGVKIEQDLHTMSPLTNAVFSSVFSMWYFIAFGALYYTLPLIGVALEKQAKSIWWTPLVYIYGLTWFPITLIGLMKRKEKTWSHTKHTRSVNHKTIQK